MKAVMIILGIILLVGCSSTTAPVQTSSPASTEDQIINQNYQKMVITSYSISDSVVTTYETVVVSPTHNQCYVTSNGVRNLTSEVWLDGYGRTVKVLNYQAGKVTMKQEFTYAQ